MRRTIIRHSFSATEAIKIAQVSLTYIFSMKFHTSHLENSWDSIALTISIVVLHNNIYLIVCLWIQTLINPLTLRKKIRLKTLMNHPVDIRFKQNKIINLGCKCIWSMVYYKWSWRWCATINWICFSRWHCMNLFEIPF